jgi:conjugative transposon TraK protein
MFPRMKNIETTFRFIRIFSIIAITGSFLAGIAFFGLAARTIDAAQSKIYILSAGKAMEAFASDRSANLAVEAKAHITDFHEHFFTLDPDEKFIADGLSRALYLADASAKRVYDNLKESGYYANVVSGNFSQRVEIDSIQLDMTGYPFHFRVFGTEKVTRPTSIATRNLITEGYLREVSRSDNDPHGLLIERWSVIDNRDIKIQQR